MKSRVILFSAALMLAASPDAYSDVCTFKQNKIDEFTQQRLVKIDWVDMTGWASSTFKRTIGGRRDIEIAAESVGGPILLKFRLKLSNAVKDRPYEHDLYDALFVPAGSRLEIVMTDESIIELVVDREVRGTSRAKYDDGWYVVTTKFTVRYPVDDATIERLAHEDVVYLRVAARSRGYNFVSEQNTIEFNINEKAQRAFKEVFGCLQQALAEDPA